MVRRITQLMIHAADTRSQRRSRPRRQLIGALFCGLNERRGTPYAGISSLPIIAALPLMRLQCLGECLGVQRFFQLFNAVIGSKDLA